MKPWQVKDWLTWVRQESSGRGALLEDSLASRLIYAGGPAWRSVNSDMGDESILKAFDSDFNQGED